MDWLKNLFTPQNIGNIVGSLGNMFTGGAAGKAGGIAGGLSNMLGGLFGGGQQSQPAQKSPLGGNSFGSQLMSGVGQNIQGPRTQSYQSPNISSIFQAFGQNKPQQASPAKAPSFTPLTGGYNQPGGQPPQQPSPQGVPQNIAKVGGAGATAPTAKPDFMQNIMSMFGEDKSHQMQTIGGAMMPMLGNAMVKTPHMPDISSLASYQKLQNPGVTLDPTMEAKIRGDFAVTADKRRAERQAAWKNLRPGADIESDSGYKRDMQDLEQSLTDEEEGLVAQARLQNKQIEYQRLQTLADADVQVLMNEYGLNYADAMALKAQIGQVGGQLTSKGLGLDQIDPKGIQGILQMFQGQQGAV